MKAKAASRSRPASVTPTAMGMIILSLSALQMYTTTKRINLITSLTYRNGRAMSFVGAVTLKVYFVAKPKELLIENVKYYFCLILVIDVLFLCRLAVNFSILWFCLLIFPFFKNCFGFIFRFALALKLADLNGY